MTESFNQIAIHISQVSKRFGATQSLDQLSLRVEKGDVFGLLGPNGAGKTTTMRALLGLVRPDEGRISVFGIDPQSQAVQIRRLTGVLLESDGHYERLTAWNNLDLHGRIWHLPSSVKNQRGEELLRSLDLWERRHERVITWSKGMRQKLAVSRALLHKPRLLLLDEPFSGLDPAAAVELRDRIVTMAREDGVTVLITTHDLAHVEKACNRVAIIEHGSIIAEGSPDGIGSKNSLPELEVRGPGLDERVLGEMRREGIILSFRMIGTAARIECTHEGRDLIGAELIRRGIVIEELRTIGNSLEDSYLSLMSSQGGEK